MTVKKGTGLALSPCMREAIPRLSLTWCIEAMPFVMFFLWVESKFSVTDPFRRATLTIHMETWFFGTTFDRRHLSRLDVIVTGPRYFYDYDLFDGVPDL